jgi:hypothetical protein
MTDTAIMERTEETEASIMEAGNAAFQRMREHRKLFRRDNVPFSRAVIFRSNKDFDDSGAQPKLTGERDWTNPKFQAAFQASIANLPWSDYFTNRSKELSAIRAIGQEPGGLEEGGAFLTWYDALPEEKREIVGHPITLWQLYQKHKKAEPKAGDPKPGNPDPNGDPNPNDDDIDDDDDDETTKPERQEDRERRQLREQNERLIQEKEDMAVKWTACAKGFGPEHVATGIAWLRTMIKDTDSSAEFPVRWCELLEAPETVATPVTMVTPKKRKVKAGTGAPKAKAKKASTKTKSKAKVKAKKVIQK